MTTSLLRRAVRNNALWCDAVCSADGQAGEFTGTLWLHRQGTPPFYPDIITLTGGEAAAEQEEAIAVLMRSRQGGWGVKDSYCAIDLSSQGFRILFEADWIALRPGDAVETDDGGLQWKRVETADELEDWERAWSGNEPQATRIFAEPLLRNPGIVFLAAHQDGEIHGGAILNHQADILGHSNVFAGRGEASPIHAGMVREARRLFPGEPIVGYESGDDLENALALGFSALGPLRIWVRD
jgi:hypothetical protein